MEDEISEEEAQQFTVKLIQEQMLELGNEALLQLKLSLDKELWLRKRVDYLN